MKKNVLIVTYYWPPASSPGVQRWLKFVKYMAHNEGIQPFIFTVKEASAPHFDNTLLEDVPSSVEVIKSNSFEPINAYNLLSGKKDKKVEVGLAEIQTTKTPIQKIAKYLRSNVFIPDAKIGWYHGNKTKLIKLVKAKSISTIITTGPPHTTHLFGLFVKRKIDISWIVDLRDPWTSIYYEKVLERSKNSAAKNRKMEEEVVEQCDQLVVVSKGLYLEFEKYNNKSTIIYNGFDEEDIPSPNSKSNSKFSLTYTGNFKSNQNLESMWEVLAELGRLDEFRSMFEIRFVGNVHQSVKDSIASKGIDHMVKYDGFVDHKEAVQIMVDAEMLLLPIPKSDGNELILTGKIFEYLASKSEILSIGPVNGDAAKLLKECSRDKMLDYNDKDQIHKRLSEAYTKWTKEGNSKKYKDREYLNYSRRAMTNKLISLIK